MDWRIIPVLVVYAQQRVYDTILERRTVNGKAVVAGFLERVRCVEK